MQPGTGYRSPLLELPGAVAATGFFEGIPVHYGDPLGEQRTLLDEVGFVDASNWPLVEVSGVDRLRWLNQLTTQSISELPVSRTSFPLLLTTEGYVDYRLIVTQLGDRAWLAPEPLTTHRLVSLLHSLRGGMQVDVQDVTPQWASMALVGQRVGDVLAHLGVFEPPKPMTVVSMAGGGWMWKVPLPGAEHAEVVTFVVPRQLLLRVAERLRSVGVRPVGVAAYEALRVVERQARRGFEADEHTLPQEVGWMGVHVDLGKTGYRGYKALARVEESGAVPRRLVLLDWGADLLELPPCGASVEWEGRWVGFVGTALHHFALGGVGLAMVARQVPDGVTVSAGGAPASVVPEPTPEAAVL